MLCVGAQSPGVPSRGRTGTEEEGTLCPTATPRRRTSLMTAPPHWGTTSHMVRQEKKNVKGREAVAFVAQTSSVNFPFLSLFVSQLFSLYSFCLLLIRPSALTLVSISAVIVGLKQLLDAQQLCDVTLLVEGKKFMCHRYRMPDIMWSFKQISSNLLNLKCMQIQKDLVSPQSPPSSREPLFPGHVHQPSGGVSPH